MKPHERWEKIEELYHAALELEAGERDKFLSEACASDAEMLEEVRSLIAARYEEGSFINRPAYEAAAEMLAESEASIVAGQRIAHYQVLEPLGKGGMGEVYLAEDARLGRKIALKMLPARFTDNRERLARFIREAKAASALNHPNIMTVYEIGESAGAHYIASEFIEGQTLRKRMAESRMKISEGIDVAAQVAGALSAAHAAGIIHRDIKPENIMLRKDGYVKVLDFGLAKLTEKSKDSQSPSLDSQAGTRIKTETEPGRVLGTINYMSPEQARGLSVDARTDIFSLGVVLYEMVAGRRPFEGATDMDVIVSILDKEPRLLSICGVAAPAELQRIINKALCKKRDERYQTIKDLWIDLKTLKEEMAFEAKLERSASPESSDNDLLLDERTPIPTTENNIAASTTERAVQTVSIKRKRVAIIPLAAVAVVAAVIVGAIVWSRPSAPSVHAPAGVAPATAPERVLNYWGIVERPDGKQFPLAGDMGFYVRQGDKIRLNFKSPQPGYLYILNEGPATGDQPLPFVVLFPSPTANQGSAFLAENKEVQIPERSWFQFDKEEGTERVWLVWSANPVSQLEAVKRFANAEDKGSINDPALDAAVREFLKIHSTPGSDLEKDDDRKQTTVKANSDILVHVINLEHH